MWPHFWAIQIMLIVVYYRMRELVRVIGKETMVQIFFGPMPSSQV